ncbi:MAG: nucleotidyl transferase AbiEii/AbiGii toxin family protein [Candidatus Riflebacteria bacterium]|nr:nucleotidyl transferase AbiEii/AbiGii toxin family protein [Candidatus Riflebacteria bacterium]
MTIPINLPASVHQRLINKAKKDGRPFNELLQYYVMERFLYRLAKSPLADRFILKGALLMQVWRLPELRPTMDIDLLGKTRNDEDYVAEQVRTILETQVTSDGLEFHPDSIRSEHISEEAEYHGIRVRFEGRLGSAKVTLQTDIGFGDIVFPGPEEADIPTMLDFDRPRLLCYSRESVIAEKFEAMVKLGRLNSRMKDFFDIWVISKHFNFEGSRLTEAIRRTFERRETLLSEEIEAFSAPFAITKQPQWTAFRKRIKSEEVPASFSDLVSFIGEFISPVAHSILSGTSHLQIWKAPGPWI